MVNFMASGPLSSGLAAGDGGGLLRGCFLRNTCEGVWPKLLIWSSTACKAASPDG